MKKIAFIISSAAAVLLLAGCKSSPEARFYMLQADDQNVAVTMVYYEHLDGAKISVEPVRVPNHLDRPQIITKNTQTAELSYSEFHRWAESLSDTLHWVLIRNLGARLPGSVVWNDRAMAEVKSEYKVGVNVLSATGTLGESAELIARWNIFSGETYELIETGLFSETLKPESASHNDYVQALSKLAADLSGQIAHALQQLPQE